MKRPNSKKTTLGWLQKICLRRLVRNVECGTLLQGIFDQVESKERDAAIKQIVEMLGRKAVLKLVLDLDDIWSTLDGMKNIEMALDLKKDEKRLEQINDKIGRFKERVRKLDELGKAIRNDICVPTAPKRLQNIKSVIEGIIRRYDCCKSCLDQRVRTSTEVNNALNKALQKLQKLHTLLSAD